MKSLLSFVAVLALALTLPAQGGGGGNNGGGGGGSGYGGGCAPPPPAPFPSPAPAPAPGPGPGPTPGPGPAPGGGVTPGSPSGGSTPTPGRGGVTPRGVGGRGSRGPFRGGKKVRISSEQSFWLGAVTLPWEGTFLPRDGGEGYDGREMTVEQAVATRDAKHGWKMKQLPTIVFVYDPSSKDHMKSLAKVSGDREFISASRYFNLFRVDVRTIKDRKIRKGLKQPTFMVFKANGDKVAAVTKATSFKPFTKSFETVFESDFAKSLRSAVASMGAVIARRAWVDDEIRRHETVLFDPVTGKVQQPIKVAIARYKKELKNLELHEEILVRLQRGALAAK